MSAVRCLLQTACFGTLGVIEACNLDLLEGPLAEAGALLTDPSDGHLLDFLDRALQEFRKAGLGAPCPAWLESPRGSLYEAVSAWVEHRNDHPGHGITSSVVEATGGGVAPGT